MDLSKKNFLASVIIIVILLAISIFAINYLVNQIKNASNEYIEAKKTLITIEKKTLSLEKQKILIDEVQSNFSKIEKSFLGKEEIVDFITTLEETALKTNNSIKIESLVFPTQEVPYFTFQLFIQGTFPNSLRFLAGIENIPGSSYRLIEIRQLDIKRISGQKQEEKETGQEAKVESDLEIRVYSE